MRKNIVSIAAFAVMVGLCVFSAWNWGASQAARALVHELRDVPPAVHVTSQVLALLWISPALAGGLRKPDDCRSWDAEAEQCFEYAISSMEPPARDPQPPVYKGVRAGDLFPEESLDGAVVVDIEPHAPAAPKAPPAAVVAP